jgi:hypothetical protein
MPRVGFEHTIPASKQAKTLHTLDHSANVTGRDPEHSGQNGAGRPVFRGQHVGMRYRGA